MADTHIRELPDGKRHLNLTKAERAGLKERKQMERIVSMFLDLEQDRTWKQIAEELGISISELKRTTKRPEFQKLYDETTVALGHDPRLQAVTSQLPDLLPLAYRNLKSLLTRPDVRDDVRLKAALEILKLNQVGKDTGTDDPSELTNFLKAHNVQIQGDVVMNLGVPAEYQQAVRRFMGTEILDAAVRTADTEEPRLLSSGHEDQDASPEPSAAQ